jgi:hypothetical protein
LRETQRWLKLIQRIPLIEKTELLNNVLNETEELIKIFVTSIKTSGKDDAFAPRTRWHQPQADAERYPYSMFDVRSFFIHCSVIFIG